MSFKCLTAGKILVANVARVLACVSFQMLLQLYSVAEFFMTCFALTWQTVFYVKTILIVPFE